MFRIDQESENNWERLLDSVGQSVESLVITTGDGIPQADSKPRTSKPQLYLSKENIEEQIEDLQSQYSDADDLMESKKKANERSSSEKHSGKNDSGKKLLHIYP